MRCQLAVLLAVLACCTTSASMHAHRRMHQTSNCGYEACTKPVAGMLNVHVVAHTHDDVGWLKTVDEYYYGTKSEIQKAGIKLILDSVVRELNLDPNRRFIYVETAYLWKWWTEQNETMRHVVKNLVDNRRLEIVSGGWSMNDEATTHYQSIIDQMTWGFRKVDDMFGTCGRPHIGWQIDPFGHSREQASLFAQMGFDGLFIGRLDFQDKEKRKKDKTMDMVWEGSPENLGAKSSLFTHVLYNNYGAPDGFCFDVHCYDRIDNNNAPRVVDQLIAYVRQQSEVYNGENIILMMGGDFHFQEANENFSNLDKLIRYVNDAQSTGTKVNLFYSTPSCFLKALHDEKRTYPSKTDDFFPYASESDAYWTGFFTSKPTLKYFERLGNNFMQVCKQLYTMADLDPEVRVELDAMHAAMGVMQHHDAITGTEKDDVAHDYARMLHEGFAGCGSAVNAAINKLTAKSPAPKNSENLPLITHESCLLLNTSSCNVTENSHNFVVTVYNPLGHVVSHYVRVPVTGLSYTVQDASGMPQEVQLVPIHQQVIELHGRKSLAKHEIVFRARDLPPLGFRSYYVTKQDKREKSGSVESVEDKERLSIGNKNLSFHLNKQGTPEVFHVGGVNITLTQGFAYYNARSRHSWSPEGRPSGAYIFAPAHTSVNDRQIGTVNVYKGALVDEVHQTYQGGWISQVVRIYHEENHAEFEWMVGPIPVNDWVGKEVITRYTTHLHSNATFYTDSNGREMIRRVRDYRPTWQLESREPIAANYYPVTSKLLLRDEEENVQVAVVIDRAQGGTSMKDGQLELMLHRRLLYDDGFGVDEPLNEQQYGAGLVARGKHYLIGGAIKGAQQQPSLSAQERILAQRKLLAPWLFLAAADHVDFADWSSKSTTQYNGLKGALPPNVHLLTLEPWRAKSLLLRVEHILEKSEDPILSQTATVNLKALFTAFTIKAAHEMTLGGNQLLKDNQRFTWRTAGTNEVHDKLPLPTEPLDLSAVTLTPMQIRTFILDIEVNTN